MAREHLIKNCSQGIDIRRRTDVFTLAGLFGGHVTGSTEDHSGLRVPRFRAKSLDQTEIGDLQQTVLGDQDVAGFQVPMDDALAVCGRYSHGQHLGPPGSVRRGEWTPAQALFQGSPVYVFHGEKRLSLVFPNIVNSDDMRMLHKGNDLSLLQEPV
jgi:hypothetical protein